MAKKDRVDQAVLHRQAQVAALEGLLRGDDLTILLESVSRSDVPHWFTPDVAILQLAVTALGLACPPGAQPLAYEGLRERYLPEVDFRRRTSLRNSQYALYAAASMRGGLEPDLLNDAGWWDTRLWIYAVHALVIYSRAAADRTGRPIDEIVNDIAAAHQLVVFG